MKTLINKILLTGIILGIGNLENIKAQESEIDSLKRLKNYEFICNSWISSDTDIYKIISFSDEIFVSSTTSELDVKRLLKENSDSAVAKLHYNHNFYNWFLRDEEKIFNFSGCNLKIISISSPLDNFRLIYGVKKKARPLEKEEFLGTIISFLSKQQNGEKGDLDIKEPNVFYVRLNDKRTVSVSLWYNPAWNVKGWDIQAYTMASYGSKYKIFFSKK